MERLQQALQMARAKRENEPQSPQPQPRKPAAEAPKEQQTTDQVAERWAALGGFTPDHALLQKHRVVTFTAGPEANHFDILRTKLALLMRQNGWKRVAITSPTPSCGKTTIAGNLIAGLGRQHDMRSILFDMDLRRPGLATLFGASPRYSISEVLDGSVPFADQAQRLRDNTAISVSPTPTPDPTRLMLSKNTTEIFDQVEHDYAPDLMIFDLPPFMNSDDTRAFLKNVDCALLIARAQKTTAHQIDVCEREIAEQTNVAGIILNQCRHLGKDSQYGYGYY